MSNYNLDRFITAQQDSFDIALNEIKSEKKQSHWMWYIFPQLKGLGYSHMSEYYGIENIDEAQAYMKNEYLRNNLISITKALLSLAETNPDTVMGFPDSLKLYSSMTLFEIAAPDMPEFAMVLDKFYDGKRDNQTLDILENLSV